ncbi:hypothetical protein BHM03_00039351 [Ensete ventricosum]|nr:hypothetical protein BHM03_00039351 [Ensete ventricosum]
MKAPGFSTERTRPSREGPLEKVASVKEVLRRASPACTARVAVATLLSTSYRPFTVAFIFALSVAGTGNRDCEMQGEELGGDGGGVPPSKHWWVGRACLAQTRRQYFLRRSSKIHVTLEDRRQTLDARVKTTLVEKIVSRFD